MLRSGLGDELQPLRRGIQQVRLEPVDNLQHEVDVRLPGDFAGRGDRSDAVVPALLRRLAIVLGVRGIKNPAELVAADITDRTNGVGQCLLASGYRRHVLARYVLVERQAHRHANLDVKRLRKLCQSIEVEFLGAQIGKFDGAISVFSRFVEGHLQPFLRLAACPYK